MYKHIVQLIRERFHPIVRFCGPQSAGEVEVEGVRGTVYLGELSIWLWPAKSSHNGVLSDEQLGDVVSPHLLVRNLLLSAQTSDECYSGFDAYGPVASDSLPGTHIYIAGNFGIANVNPNPCGGGLPTDGEGVIFDTWQDNTYNQQAVIDNNILIFNGGRAIHVYLNSSTPHAKIYIRHNTTYANSQGTDQDIACGEIALQSDLSTEVYANLSETGSALCYGSQNPYVLSVAQTIDASDVLYANYGYSASGYNTTGTGTGGFAFGPNNTFANPQFANPPATVPAAPNCGGYASVPACMAQMVANFTPTNAAAAGYGYQIPSSTSVYDPLFPQWLCNVNLPTGLISKGCKPGP